jgi:predicted RND superfamily exporter protein
MNLATFMKIMHRFVHEEDDEYFKVPDTSAAISEYFYTYDLSDPGSFEFVVDHDYQNSVLVAYADNTNQKTVQEILESSRKYAAAKFNDDKVEAKIAGGVIGICGANNEMIKKWIILAAVFSLIASFLIATILFTSFLAPIFLMVPLAFGTIVTFAILFLAGIETDSNATTVVSMGIGVGIDAGVYLLFRFREEFAKSKDFAVSLFKSYATSGTALLFSFSALILGCWSVIPLPIYIGHVGFSMGMVLFMNFIFTFTVLPALWAIFKPNFLFK